MSALKRPLLSEKTSAPSHAHHAPGSARRGEVEGFIRDIFAEHYDAQVTAFAPQLLSLEQAGRITAAAGWRGADQAPLYLENYLDAPIEQLVSQIAQRPIARDKIVEVGNLAAAKPGGSVAMIVTMARHFDRLGYEWVTFTATEELVRIFGRVGLPLLAIGRADPARLGADAAQWGRYYETSPIVVTGRIRLAFDRIGKSL